MKHSLILMPVFALALSGVATAHEIKGEIGVNIFSPAYVGCVKAASENVEEDLAMRWCTCVYEQMGMHDREDHPNQKNFTWFSKYTKHATKMCEARNNRGEL
ncbi:MAG: hypothetical protein L3J89_04225 [Gammaproteobacteria bacterium]|nr:hypothetical protein [Gammaproteobacteria bacterium]